MKVILLKTVSNLGQTGEIKEVADGFARNFLLPKGFAKIATDAAIKEMEIRKQKKQKVKANLGHRYTEIAKKVNNLKIIMKAKAEKEKKTLFAAIKPEQIAQELKDRHYDIPAKYIKLAEPIKSLGYYDIIINFGNELTAKVGLTVERAD